MRTILLDWIVDIHLKFKMFPQTLFIVTAIIDKYLSIRTVRKEELQLVGSAALLIAAKYEETYQVPESNELVSLSAKAFTKSELLKMEADIVKALDFNLIFNTPYHFFDPFCKIANYDQKKFFLAQYTLELALMDVRFLKFKPSLLAASTIFLINKIKRAEIVWPDVLMAASGYE
jgi:cyclin B